MRTHYTALVYMNSLDVHLSYLRHLNEAVCVHVEGRREVVKHTLTTYKNHHISTSSPAPIDIRWHCVDV